MGFPIKIFHQESTAHDVEEVDVGALYHADENDAVIHCEHRDHTRVVE